MRKQEPNEQDLIPGQFEGEFTEEKLLAENQRIAKDKKRLIGEFNKINTPLMVTVYDHGKPWTIRNKAFWKALQQRDDIMTEFMEKYLSEAK